MSGFRSIGSDGFLRVGLWSCRGVDPVHDRVETVPRDTIAFPLFGTYLKEVAGEKIVADRSVAVFYPRHQEYRVRHPVPGGDGSLVLTARRDRIEESVAWSGGTDRDPFGVGHVPVAPRVAVLARALARSADRVSGLEIEETARELLRAVLSGERREPGTNRGGRGLARRRRAVRIVKETIAARYRECLLLEDLAESAGYSPGHLSVVFREVTGTTVHRHLDRVRLLAALEALPDSRNLTRLALRVGYSSHSHFTWAFRREFGRPPGEIRAGLRAGDLDRLRAALGSEVGR